MEIHFSPEQQERLVQIATKAGTEPAAVVANVVRRYLEAEDSFVTAVERGIAAAERGEVLDENAMKSRLDAMFER